MCTLLFHSFYIYFQSVEVFDKENLIPEEDDEVVTATSSDVALINSDNALVSVKEKSTQEKVSIFIICFT